jgi:hypothetical protein
LRDSCMSDQPATVSEQLESELFRIMANLACLRQSTQPQSALLQQR